MQINWKTVSKALAAIVIYDELVCQYNVRVVIPKKNLLIKEANERADANGALADYYATLLDSNQIQPTSFDHIVMNTITEKKQ